MLLKTSQALLNHYNKTRLLTLSHQNVQSPAGLTFQSKWENIMQSSSYSCLYMQKQLTIKTNATILLHTRANLTEMCCYNKSLSFLKWFLSGIQKANGFIKCFTLQISSISSTSITTDSLYQQVYKGLPHIWSIATSKLYISSVTLTAASSSPADVSQIDVS